MAIYSLRTFKTRLKKSSRILALDIGRKTIGLAISNSELTLASQLETLKREKLKNLLPKFKTLIKERNIGGLLIGFPLNVDGSRSKNCDRVEGFAQSLLDHEDVLLNSLNTELLITFYDERFSTKISEALLIEADISRQKRKKVIDQMAATLFLKSALDAMQLFD